jgi:hypothetical protein
MASHGRLGLVAGIFLAAALAMGCNVLSLPWVLFGPEPKMPAEMKEITNKDKRNDVSVVVLTYAGPETRPEFIKVDRDLADQIARELRAGFEYNEQFVKVVPTRKVEKFKQDHPGWQSMDLASIGKYFGASYVLYVEIDNDTLSLYERGSGRELYRGHADVTVSLVDLHNRDEGSDRRTFSYNYPDEAKGIMATDSNPLLFKQMFLSYVARQVAWCVTPHKTQENYEQK